MAKTDKSSKKAASKKADPIKTKPVVPASSKEILARAAALAKPTTKKAKANGKKRPSASSDSSGSSSPSESSSEESESSEEVPQPAKSIPTSVKKTSDSSSDSSDASSSEESSSEESDSGNKGKISAPVKTTPAAAQKTADSSDDSSSASSSSSEESDDDKEMASVPTQTSPNKGTKKSEDSKDKSSDASSSEETSSGSDNDEEVDKTSAPAPAAPAEGNKKRKADNEAAVVPKKAKLVDDTPKASGEETKSIFVGRLSWNVDNDWLAQEFSECGEIEFAQVQMDRNTGRSRGFGYVHFKTTDAVEKALTLNGKEIDGRAVNIDKSNPPDKKASSEKRSQAFGDTSSPPSAVLFVGNLSFGVNEDTLWETFGEHGDIKSVRVPTDRDSGRPKGFAYVEFSEVGAAKKAHAALQGFELDGRSMRLDFSQPRDSAGGRGGGQGGRGRGGFGGDRGRGAGRGGRGGDRGGRGRGRGTRTGGITQFEGRKITF